MEEIFETKDVNESDDLIIEDRRNIINQFNDSIDNNSNIVDNLQDRIEYFSSKKLNTANKDYSVDILKKKSKTEYSIISDKWKSFESPLERLNRLRREVDSFSGEIQILTKKSEDEFESAQKIMDRLQILENNIKEVNTDHQSFINDQNILMLQNFQGENENERVTYELYCENSNVKKWNSELQSLKTRLSNIEYSLGVNRDRSLDKSITQQLEYFDSKISLLSDGKLSLILKKLKSLPSDDNSTLNFNNESIDELYQFYTRFENTASEIPNIANRLVSLRSLHLLSVDMINEINFLHREQTEILDLLKLSNTSLANLDDVLSQNLETIQNNIDFLEKRISQLNLKISSI